MENGDGKRRIFHHIVTRFTVTHFSVCVQEVKTTRDIETARNNNSTSFQARNYFAMFFFACTRGKKSWHLRLDVFPYNVWHKSTQHIHSRRLFEFKYTEIKSMQHKMWWIFHFSIFMTVSPWCMIMPSAKQSEQLLSKVQKVMDFLQKIVLNYVKKRWNSNEILKWFAKLLS